MRIIFFGTPEFAVPALEALLRSRHEVIAVVAQPDRPAGRGMRVQSPPVAELARRRGIELLQPQRIREDEFLDRIRSYAPDAGVVVAYGRILPDSLLGIPRHGFLNVHASLLPEYRGAAPIQRAIEHGKSETGVTIMRVDAELDHGPILDTERTVIGSDERAPALSGRLAVAGARKLVEVLDSLERGPVVEREQDHVRATYASKIEKDEGRVEWATQSAAEIVNKFRAFDPWPGIFTSIGGETVKLTNVEAVEGAHSRARGEITAVTGDGIDVTTRKGILRIVEGQRAGKRPVRAMELARGFRLEPGARLS